MRVFSLVRSKNGGLAIQSSGKETNMGNSPSKGDQAKTEYHDEDVQKVIDSHTGDGPGDEDPGESDFVSFAGEDVLKEDDQ
jgi:hypothetical protein